MFQTRLEEHATFDASVHLSMYVCMSVCTCICMYVCMYRYIYIYIYMYMYIQTYIHTQISVRMHIYVRMHTLYAHSITLTSTNDTAAMGWLRLVGSFKLYVSFAEYRLFYRALLQKRSIIFRSLLIVATPYPHTIVPHTTFNNCRQR